MSIYVSVPNIMTLMGNFGYPHFRPTNMSCIFFESIPLLCVSDTHPFNLHHEKCFEGCPVKFTQIFLECTLIVLGCRHVLIFLGYSLDFFLIYKYETQLFSSCHPEKNRAEATLKKVQTAP